MNKFRRILIFWLMISAGALIFLYMLLVVPFRLTETYWTVVNRNYTYTDPLKIALISDVHAINPWMNKEHIQKIVERTNALDADVVLLLGDYVATHPFGIQMLPENGISPYKNLKSKCGVFAILGNHDVYGSKGWPEALEESGIKTLRNDAEKVECVGRSLWIAGVDELWRGNADVKKTIQKITNDDPVILMMHNPDSFPEIPDSVALSVAGHTHGGQIVFPWIGPLSFVVPSRYGLRYVYGHIHEDGRDLVVSGGLGSTGLPLRLLREPEITVVTLKNQHDSLE